MEKIRVFLADRNTIFRQALHKALSEEEAIEVLAEAETAEQALTMLTLGAFFPQVVILDANFLSQKDLDLPGRITEHVPSVSLIVVADYERNDQLLLAIEAGAAAFLTRTTTASGFAKAIRDVSQGEYLIDENLIAKARFASQEPAQPEHETVAEEEEEAPVARFPVVEKEATIAPEGKVAERPAEDVKASVRITIEKGITTVTMDGKKVARFTSMQLRVKHLATTCELSGATFQGQKYSTKFDIAKGNIELEASDGIKFRV